MITNSTIYWLTRLSYLWYMCTFFCCLTFWLMLCFLKNIFDITKEINLKKDYIRKGNSYATNKVKEWKNELKLYYSRFWCIFLIFLFSVVGVCLIPNNMKTIAAIYLIPKIVNNQEINKLPTNTAKMLNIKLQEWIGNNLKTEVKS